MSEFKATYERDTKVQIGTDTTPYLVADSFMGDDGNEMVCLKDATHLFVGSHPVTLVHPHGWQPSEEPIGEAPLSPVELLDSIDLETIKAYLASKEPKPDAGAQGRAAKPKATKGKAVEPAADTGAATTTESESTITE